MNKYVITRTNIAVATRPQTLEYVYGANPKDAVRRLKFAIRQNGGCATDYRYSVKEA